MAPAMVTSGSAEFGQVFLPALLYWNPTTNAFKAFDLVSFSQFGLDINRSTIFALTPLPGASPGFGGGDVWVLSRNGPIVNFRGTNSFRTWDVGAANPRGIRVNPVNGKVYLGNVTNPPPTPGGEIIELDPATNGVRRWSTVNDPYQLFFDGTFLWATATARDVFPDQILRLEPVTGALTRWNLPVNGSFAPGGEDANFITKDLEGKVWFTETAANKIGRLDPVAKTITEYTKSGIAGPQNIASSGIAATLQALWTEDPGNTVSVLTPAVSTIGVPTSVIPSNEMVSVSSSSATFSDFTLQPLTAIITPVPCQVVGVDPSGITRFPVPPGTSEPRGITRVILPQTVFGSLPNDFGGGASFPYVFQFQSPAIVATPPDAAITAMGVTFSATEGQPFAAQTVANFHDPDPMSTAAEYNATIDWGDGSSSPPPPVTITPTGVSSSGNDFSVKGDHTYTEEGTYTLKVTITDVDNPKHTATATSTATVVDAALHSSCAAAPVSTQSFSGPTATFTDDNAFATKADFTATINWGDGASSSGTISGGPGAGPYTVSGNHTYSTTGTFTISTLINDDGGAKTTATCQVIVFGFPTATGSFVIGDLADPPPIVGDSVTWWSSQWAKPNPMSGGPAPASMKGFSGFEDNLLGLSRTCGSSWTTDTGNATPAPPSVPPFMGVLVSSRITQNGSVITGNIKQVVVVRNNPGYAPNPGNPGTGTIVAIVCTM